MRPIRARCSRICCPIVRTGFSAESGSCGMKAMSRPSRLRRRFGGIVTRSSPAKSRLPLVDGESGWQELRDGAADHGLAGAGFADEAENLSGLQIEVQIRNDRKGSNARRCAHGQIAGCEKAHGHARSVWLRRVSSVRRRPSPRTLKPNTVMKIARIGQTRFHGAW